MPSAPASELCFLSGLPAKTAGQKVRFLGCVTHYDPAAGVLTLQHHYQHQSSASASGAAAPSSAAVHARVNVDLVLGRLTAEQMTVGAWVNVMGYVTEAPDPTAAGDGRSATGGGHSHSGKSRRTPRRPPPSVNIQAILLWSTGPLDVQVYERQLSEMLDLKPGT